MNVALSNKTQLFGAWSGVLFLVLMLIGWWLIAGFLPVHSPTLTADQIADIYQKNHTKILVGMVFIMFGSMMGMFFSGAVAFVLSRIEGCMGMLTGVQIMSGFGNYLFTTLPPLLWIIAAYRIDRNIDLLLLLNDSAWILFIGALTPFLPMLITVGIGAFNDKREHPVLPRWLGFLSCWTLLLMLPGQLIFFFKVGPFAWNGVIGFWIPVSVYAFWFMAVTFCLFRSTAQKREPL